MFTDFSVKWAQKYPEDSPQRKNLIKINNLNISFATINQSMAFSQPGSPKLDKFANWPWK